jgi:hypothetical protein
MESFQAQSETVVYTVSALNYYAWMRTLGRRTFNVKSISPNFNDTVYTLLKYEKAFPKEIIPSTSSVLWIASEMDYEQYMKPIGVKPAVDVMKAYFVGLGLPERLFRMECAFDIANKKIGYIDRIDKHFILSIIYGYRIPLQSVELVEVPLEYTDRLPKFIKENDIFLIAAHIVPENPLNMFIKTQPLSVVGWGRIDIDRLRVFNPYLTKEEIDMKRYFQGESPLNNSLVMDREKRGPVVAINIGAYPLNTYTPPPDPDADVTETFITRLDISPDMYDPGYRCYGDNNIEQKALCVSPYNQQGDPKRVMNKWDKPCFDNTDCPFYKANKNYDNDRGKCLPGGICEMPSGILRTAYRTYDNSNVFTPFCYQCPDPSDMTCCASQEKPDYVFPNDREERQKAGLPTFIPII